MNLQVVKFRDVDVNDHFFDSLRADYAEFQEWFTRKANDCAYLHRDSAGVINGFLYQKIEFEKLEDVIPAQPSKKRMKIGTLKIDAHGTRLGERFIKKSVDYALKENVEEIYVTIFPKHTALISLLTKYGFKHEADKVSKNGKELVLIKNMRMQYNDINLDYPFIDLKNQKYLLSIYPEWHSRLLPDSILKTEAEDAILYDVSHTNSIHKVYLTKMTGTENLKHGDILVIYRTTDGKGSAHYRSVVTSLCVVDEVRIISTFASLGKFLDYTRSYSIFTEQELTKMYNNKRYPIIIKFNYNYALPRRVPRGELIEKIGIKEDYWGFFNLSDQQFLEILRMGHANESITFN